MKGSEWYENVCFSLIHLLVSYRPESSLFGSDPSGDPGGTSRVCSNRGRVVGITSRNILHPHPERVWLRYYRYGSQFPFSFLNFSCQWRWGFLPVQGSLIDLFPVQAETPSLPEEGVFVGNLEGSDRKQAADGVSDTRLAEPTSDVEVETVLGESASDDSIITSPPALFKPAGSKMFTTNQDVAVKIAINGILCILLSYFRWHQISS